MKIFSPARRWSPFAIPLIAASFSCVACAQGVPFTFVTNWYAQAEHGGFYEAQAEGLYAKAGLDVTVKMGGPQVNAVQILAANQAQCIITDDIMTMNARAHGVPMKIVATTFQHDPTVIIAHEDVPHIGDLKTRTLLVASGAYAGWYPWAKATFGFTDDHVRPYTFNQQPFLTGAAIAEQGYLTSEPFALSRLGARFKVFTLSDYGYPPYGNAIACREDVIAQHPDQVSAFLSASMQGWKDYLNNPTAGNALIHRENPDMTDAQLAYSVDKLRSTGLVTGGDAARGGIGVVTAARFAASYKMAVTLKLVDGSAVSSDSFYTTSLIERHPVLP